MPLHRNDASSYHSSALHRPSPPPLKLLMMILSAVSCFSQPGEGDGGLALPEDYCGSCFGARDGCCQTCREVTEAYTAKGWSAEDIRKTAEQVRRGRSRGSERVKNAPNLDDPLM